MLQEEYYNSTKVIKLQSTQKRNGTNQLYLRDPHTPIRQTNN